MTTSAPDPGFAAPVPSGSVTPAHRPSFSVVLAAWQAAGTIGAALDSVLAQTEQPKEIVVCDDGSTDDLKGAVRPFGDAVRLITRPHLGAGAARNAAASATEGEFIVVLDADDTWHPRRLERLGDLAAVRPDLDVLTTDAWFVADGRRRGRFCEENAFETEDQVGEILRRTYFFGHLAVRRRRWFEVGGYATDLLRGEDWDFELRLLLTGSRAGCVMEPLATYTIHEGSLSDSRYESLMARVEVLDRAQRQFDLTPVQLAVLRDAKSIYRRRAVAARAEHALVMGAPGRRRACLELMLAVSGPRGRLSAARGILAPAWAGRRLRAEAERRGRLRTDRGLPPVSSGLDGDDE